MVEAPEKIFLTPAEGTRLQPGTTQQRDPWWDFDGAAWTTGPEKDIDVEYVRADIAASQLAEARAEYLSASKDAMELAGKLNTAEAERDRLAADLEYWQTVKHSSHWKAQVEAMAPALRQCQKILAVLSRPEGQADISILWAQCVEAEAKARAALAGKE